MTTSLHSSRTLSSKRSTPPIAIPGRRHIGIAARFSVYRNTLIKACIDALAASYPSVTVLAGAEWSRGASLAYARSTPPSSASLLEYGQNFPEFLASFSAGDNVPYLADVARLDRCWNMAHAAGDDAMLQAADIRS